MFRRFLACRPGEVSRVIGFWSVLLVGCPGHGPALLLVESAAEIGFVWSPEMVGWVRGRLAGFEQFGWSYSALSGGYSGGLEE